jgi:tetratricopeptide (TPR) repeat protein
MKKLMLLNIIAVTSLLFVCSCSYDSKTVTDDIANVSDTCFKRINKDIFRSKGDTVELQKLLDESLTANYIKGTIQANDLLGLAYRNYNSYNKSIFHHKRALSLAKESGDTVQIFFALNNLGVVYRRIDDWIEATKCYHEVLMYIDNYSVESDRREKSRAVALNGLGNVYLLSGDENEAIRYLKSALITEKELKSWRGQAINYLCIGGVFKDMNVTDSALHYYKESLNININNRSKIGQAICYLNIGGLYETLNNNVQAEMFYKESAAISDSIKDFYYGSAAAISLGDIEFKQRNYNNAMRYLTKGYNMATKIDSKSSIEQAAKLLSEIYSITGDYKRAHKWNKIATETSNKIINQEKTEKLAILNSRYKLSEKEKIIAEQNVKIKQKEYTAKVSEIITISVVSISVLLFITFFFIVRNRRVKQKSDKLKLEHRLLRSQMNPHFIFNSLTSIQSYLYKNDGVKAAKLLGLFSSLMRSVLENSTKELVTLEEEERTIYDYLKLEQIRTNNMFDYDIHISPTIEKEFEMIPPMLIQPFIENSIKHGIADIQTRGHIDINIEKENNLYSVTVIDNGGGFDIDKMNKKKSYALKIFNQRLQNIYNIKDSSFVIEKPDNNIGTKVSFKIPVNLN